MQLVSGKVEFNTCQDSVLWHNSFLVSLRTVQPTFVCRGVNIICIPITLFVLIGYLNSSDVKLRRKSQRYWFLLNSNKL